MYEKRVKVFIGVSLAVLLVCMLRLAQLQLFTSPELQDEIAKATQRRGTSKQFKTLRGTILDRRGAILAADMPQYQICIKYSLSCFLDDRVVQAKRAAAQTRSANPSQYEINNQVDDKRQDLERIIDKCSRLGVTREQVEGKIKALNDAFWNARSFLCWARGNPDPNLIAKYRTLNSVPQSEALVHFERQHPDPAARNKLVTRVDVNDIPGLNQTLALVDLKTDDEVSDAQLALLDVDDVDIVPTGHRYYPYRSTAAQTIGWVGQATQPRDVKAYEDDPLANYRKGEVCGREDGVEYVCEGILRGRRGEIVHDVDGQLVRETETEFGQNVQLTLDIELQKQIEQRLTDPKINPQYYNAPMAGALIDIRSGDILALLSLPSYDLNAVRYEYGTLQGDPNQPMRNRALNRLYPPGSVAKPAVLIAGLETGAITPEEPISCPAAPAPAGWPNCWIWRQYKTGHDETWKNTARNAIRGSCNCYFSHLADRLDPKVLQEWFFQFGYGREVPLSYPEPPALDSIPRRLRQAAGQIGSTIPSTDAETLDQLPPLFERDRKMFGIGQSNFRVTPLQVANAFATLARRGQSKPPRLFLSPDSPPAAAPVELPVSAATLAVVYDGMHAVVYEHGGTAYEAFLNSGLTQRGVTVYGKTGSTERPFNAWFAGFAQDHEGPRLALAVVVEGGQHGGGDAGTLAREIFQLCVEAGYVGDAATK
jgi:penicillin-binding protein 2